MTSHSRRSSVSDVDEDPEIIDPAEMASNFKVVFPSQKGAVEEMKAKDSLVMMVDEGAQAQRVIPSLEDILYDEIIKSQKCDFTLSDPLFSMKSPVEVLDDSDKCEECNRKIKTKKKLGCKFCGRIFCENCLKQKRPFPGNPKSRHPICDNCALKFFIKQLYEEYTKRVGEKDAIIKEMSLEFRDIKKQYTELSTSYNQRKRDYKSERKSDEEKLKELEITLSKVKREQMQLNEDNRRITEEINDMMKAQEEINKKHQEGDTNLGNIKNELSELISERDKIKRNCNTIEKEIAEYQKILAAERRRQPPNPHNGKNKNKNLGNDITEQQVDRHAIGGSFVGTQEKKCCAII